jgi:hypothetical protein
VAFQGVVPRALLGVVGLAPRVVEVVVEVVVDLALVVEVVVDLALVVEVVVDLALVVEVVLEVVVDLALVVEVAVDSDVDLAVVEVGDAEVDWMGGGGADVLLLPRLSSKNLWRADMFN